MTTIERTQKTERTNRSQKTYARRLIYGSAMATTTALALACLSTVMSSARDAPDANGVLASVGPAAPGETPNARTAKPSQSSAAKGAYVSTLAACGEGEMTAVGRNILARGPYLQRVTHESAYVVFAMAAGGSEGAPTVAITTPQGETVTRVRASADKEAVQVIGRQFLAELTGLAPATTYCYAITDANGAAWTQRFGLRTAPPRGSSDEVRFVVLGDSGTGRPPQIAVARQMAKERFDLLLHTGDVAYDEGTPAQLADTFFLVYRRLIASAPAFPSAGNHDLLTHDGQPFRDAFVLPENTKGADGRERWYSFDWGRVHFIALDTEHADESQKAWLEADLAANRLPFTVVYGHRPPIPRARMAPTPSIAASSCLSSSERA